MSISFINQRHYLVALISILGLVLVVAFAMSLFGEEKAIANVPPELQRILDEKSEYWRRINVGDVEAGMQLVGALNRSGSSNGKEIEKIYVALLHTQDARIFARYGQLKLNNLGVIRNSRKLNEKETQDLEFSLKLLRDASGKGDVDAKETLLLYHQYLLSLGLNTDVKKVNP